LTLTSNSLNLNFAVPQ